MNKKELDNKELENEELDNEELENEELNNEELDKQLAREEFDDGIKRMARACKHLNAQKDLCRVLLNRFHDFEHLHDIIFAVDECYRQIQQADLKYIYDEYYWSGPVTIWQI